MRKIGFALIALGSVCGVAFAAPDFGGRPASKSGTVIVPDEFLRRWDPVTIFFTQRFGPANGGPEDAPERFVRMNPSHPGAFTWLDATTLQFRPAEPWPALERFTFATNGESFRLSTLMAPPTATIPNNGAEGLEPVEAITLTFPEPLPLESLSKMVKLELRPRPGLDAKDARWLTRDDVTLKSMERKKRSDPATYVISLRDPVPENTRAIVHYQLSLDDKREESFAETSFSTMEAFRVTGFGCRGQRFYVTPEGTKYEAEQAMSCKNGERTIEVDLSAEPRALGPVEAKNLVRFTPAVPNLKFNLSGRTLYVSGDFDWETLYKVSLHPTALSDTKNRPLVMRGTSEIHVYFPRRESYLKWRASQGIVERYGPQMVPIDGRGFDRLDLRIYPVDALDRRFWPFPDRPIVVDEQSRPPSPGEEPEHDSSDIKSHIKALGSPPFSRLVDLPLRKASGSASFGVDLAPHLTFVAGEKAAGTYLVGMRKLDGSKERFWMRVQVTDLSLSTFEEAREVRFAVTKLSSGASVGGATVRIEGMSNGSWVTVFTGTTDAGGILRWVPPGYRPNVSISLVRVVVETKDDRLVLSTANPPDGYRENRWSSGREHDWLQWTVQADLSSRGEQPQKLCHIFTERPVYRPDEEVHVKGYFRRRHHGELVTLAPKDDYQVVIQGPGDLSWRAPAVFTAAGGFYHRFQEKDLPTGVYSARLENKKLERENCEISFRMEAYRLPTFEVRVHGPDDVPLDREFKLDLTSTYYAGGPVAGRPVRWRVTQFPYDWTPPAPLKGYFYSTDTRYSRGGEFQATPSSGKEDTTNDEGGSSLPLNPALEATAQPRSYVVEATVTGDDDQTVTATKRTNALPPFVLGLSVPRFLERAKTISPKIVVVDSQGQPVENKEVVVRLIHRTWHSHLEASDFSDGVAKYITDVVDEKLLERKVNSGKAPVTADLAIPESGVYVVEIEARDRLGRAQVVAVDLYAGGDQPVSWRKPETAVFTVVTDKTSYDPGDTATFVLQSPFQSARVLVVVEEPGVNQYEWIDVSGGKATYKYVVKKNEVPRFPVHFVLMRGRVTGSNVAPRRGATDLGKPATMAATNWLAVNPVENRVEVKLDYPARARPGDKIDVEIELTTMKKKPLPGEVTLWLVDQAVLALGEEQPLDPLSHFITQVSSYLAVRDTRNAAFGELPLAENPGGDGDAESEAGDILDRTTVRKNFKSVPYFNPEIRVGPNGKAKVTIQLPDNLTVFKLRAKAVSGSDRFGFGTGSLAVRLPVIVQPQLPRFARAGDEVIGGGLARVVEGDPGPGNAEARITGATVAGPLKRPITFEANRTVRIEFPMTVSTPPLDEKGNMPGAKIDLTVGAERTSDKARDAFQVSIPVLPDRGLIKQRVLADVEGGKSLSVPAIAEPARKGSLVRTVLVSSEPALVRMAAGLDFLMTYPYGATEARISRARAYLALKDLRSALYMQQTDADLKRAVEETLEWIGSTVDGRGLVAYWPGADGYVSLTAWTVEFMVDAKRAGFSVNDNLYKTLLSSLEAALRSDYSRFIDGESWAERVYALDALAHAQRFNAAYAAELSRKTDYLNLESVAGVVQAFAASGDSKSPTVRGLNDSLAKGLIVRLHQGKEIYGGLQEGRGGPRSSLILPSETRTVAEVMRAMSQVNPDHERVPLLVDALVTLGRDDGWGSTNANASALLALADRVRPKTARKDAAARTVEVKSGGKTVKTLSLGPGSPIAFMRVESGEALEIFASGHSGLGPVVVRVETSYVPAGDGSEVAAASAGFVVTRDQKAISLAGDTPEKLEISAPSLKISRKIGDVVEEHVQIVNPKDRAYVAVVVPLAGGMEPMNPSLATAPPEAKPSRDDTRRPTYTAFLDDRVAYYFDSLPKGTYDFYFRARASTAGKYTQPAAYAEMMYDGAVTGRSPGARVVVERGAE